MHITVYESIVRCDLNGWILIFRTKGVHESLNESTVRTQWISAPHSCLWDSLNRYNADTSTGLYSFPQCAAFSPFITGNIKDRPKDVDILTVQDGHIYTGHPRGAFTLFAPFNRIQRVTPFIDEGFDNAPLSSKVSLSECSKFGSLKEHKIVSLCLTFCSASLGEFCS